MFDKYGLFNSENFSVLRFYRDQLLIALKEGKYANCPLKIRSLGDIDDIDEFVKAFDSKFANGNATLKGLIRLDELHKIRNKYAKETKKKEIYVDEEKSVFILNEITPKKIEKAREKEENQQKQRISKTCRTRQTIARGHQRAIANEQRKVEKERIVFRLYVRIAYDFRHGGRDNDGVRSDDVVVAAFRAVANFARRIRLFVAFDGAGADFDDVLLLLVGYVARQSQHSSAIQVCRHSFVRALLVDSAQLYWQSRAVVLRLEFAADRRLIYEYKI